MTYTDKETLIYWVEHYYIRARTPLLERSSYGLKHRLQDATGIYVTNAEFKEVMLECGFRPFNPEDENQCYFISEKSPGIYSRFSRELGGLFKLARAAHAENEKA